MQALYDVPAPAKLNLFLHINGQRPDGYHLIQSVFMLIDWCDTLHFAKSASGQITREDLGTPLPENDLTVRAARALGQTAWVIGEVLDESQVSARHTDEDTVRGAKGVDGGAVTTRGEHPA